MSEFDNQRKVTRIALKVLSKYGFVLAGSGSIREHGLINRPTEDVDLFTIMHYKSDFSRGVDLLWEELKKEGYRVYVSNQQEMFAQIIAENSETTVKIDMGIDWRRYPPPAQLDIGSVLSIDDAVGNKVAALYSRGEPRDYLDVDSIRCSGEYSDKELLMLAKDCDPGFDAKIFAGQLKVIVNIPYRAVRDYHVSEVSYRDIQKRFIRWAEKILGQ